jgi:queuine tRNA-ribosyltransferase
MLRTTRQYYRSYPVGEPEEMYAMTEIVCILPEEPNLIYLMGVRTPINILEYCVKCGTCSINVMPTRNAETACCLHPTERSISKQKMGKMIFSPLDEMGHATRYRIYTKTRHLFAPTDI